MRHKSKIQNIVRTVMKSRFYFDLSLQERHDLVEDILRKFPTSLSRSMFFQERDLSLRRVK